MLFGRRDSGEAYRTKSTGSTWNLVVGHSAEERSAWGVRVFERKILFYKQKGRKKKLDTPRASAIAVCMHANETLQLLYVAYVNRGIKTVALYEHNLLRILQYVSSKGFVVKYLSISILTTMLRC